MSTTPTPSDHGPVDRLAEEFLARHRRGERPAIAEYIELHPEWADEIREVFPALLMLEQFKPDPDKLTGSHPHRPGGLDRSPQRLGEYRILREVGRGGMGVVYEAVQEPLGRHVALKVLPGQGRMDSVQIERFRLEASSAARLHHTNIVPVFGVGEHDGVHYYSMQFIHGTGLDVVLRDLRRLRDEVPAIAGTSAHEEALTVSIALAHGLLGGRAAVAAAPPADAATEAGPAPDVGEAVGPAVGPEGPPAPAERSGLADPSEAHYFRSVARIGVQVADALAHAHAHGVLHRDIKPSNLLLDAEGQAWVTDFGLAKLEGSAGPTRTGDIVGTLRYMAPERFDGRSDPRSDIYGLGATLYELLVLRPAFGEADRPKLIDRVLHEPPTPPRRLDPEVPRDLETVVLKAMAKDPADRYTTARELAEDLRRFRDDRPILSRRARLPERAWRWCRRNPAVAVLAALAAGLMITVATVSTAAAFRLGEKNLEIGGQISQIRDQRDRINADLVRIRGAESDAQSQLFESLVAQARAGRFSGRVGQRFDSLDALARAARLARELGLPEPRMAALRDEAIACLALPDLRRIHEWDEPGDTTLALDYDFRRFARCTKDGSLTIHRMSDGAELLRLTTDRSTIGRLIFSPDGRYLGVESWSSGLFQVWDLDHKALVVDEHGNGYAMDQDFSPDSHRFALTRPDGAVVVYDLASGRIEHRWEMRGASRSPAFSPDGTRVAVLTGVDPRGASLQILDVGTGEQLKAFQVRSASHMLWHPDGTTLGVVEDNGRLSLLDAATGALKLAVDTRTFITHFAFHPSGRLVATSGWSNKLRLWDIHTGKEVLDIPVAGGIGRIFSRDGRMLATRDLNGRPSLWELAADTQHRRLSPIRPTGHLTQYFGPAVAPDGRLLVVPSGDGHVLELWDLTSGQLLKSFTSPPTRYIAFDPSGDLWCNTPNGLLRWPVRPDPGSSRVFRLGPPVPEPVPGSFDEFSLSRDGRVVVVSRYRNGGIAWHVGAMASVPLRPHHDVRFVSASPDGRWVATGRHGGDDVSVKVWDARDGALVKELSFGTSSTVIFSPDGRWLVTNGGGCRLWEVGSWRPGPVVGGTGLGFSPDGGYLVVETGTGVLRLVDSATGNDLARLEAPPLARAERAAFTPDGRRLIVSGIDSTHIHVWDLRAVRRQLDEIGLGDGFPVTAGPAATDDPPPIERIDVIGGDPASLKLLPGRHELVSKLVDLRRLFSINLSHPEEFHLRAHQWMGLKQWPAATADLDFALHDRPGDDHLRELRGECRRGSGDPSGAASDLVAVLKTLPDGRSLAATRTRIDRLLASDVATFECAVALRPDDLQLWTARGRYLAWQGHWREAVSAYSHSVPARPLDDDWVECAAALVLAGDVAGYRQLCESLVARLEATATPSAFELALASRVARLSPDSGIDPATLLRWADAAADADPKATWIRYTRGAALARAGRLELASEALGRTAAENPTWSGRVIALYAQAIAFARLGSEEEARGLFEQAECLLVDAERTAESLAIRFPPALYVGDYLEAQVLRREARALLGSADLPSGGTDRRGKPHRSGRAVRQMGQDPRRETPLFDARAYGIARSRHEGGRTPGRDDPGGSSDVKQESLRVLDPLLDPDEEADRLAAVDDPVVVGEGQVHHGADDDLVADGDRAPLDRVHPEDAALGRVEDRHQQQRAEDAAVGDREGAALEVADGDLAVAGLDGIGGDRRLDLGEGEPVAVADDRHHQPAIERPHDWVSRSSPQPPRPARGPCRMATSLTSDDCRRGLGVRHRGPRGEIGRRTGTGSHPSKAPEGGQCGPCG